MTTATMTVNAPSKATEVGFMRAMANRGMRIARDATARARGLADRTGITKVASFIKRYATKAWGLARQVVRAAGAIPLAVLAISTRTGQKVIRQVVGTAWSLWSWGCNKVIGALDWTLRLFGKPGNALADRSAAMRAKVQGSVKVYAKKASAFITPYLSPDRVYMKGAKTVSYAMVAFGLIGKFVPGVWKIPAYALAALAGVVSEPSFRRSILVNRIFGTFNSDFKAKGRQVVAEMMDSMIREYGPDMTSWSSSAKGDYAIRQAIYNSLDGVADPFKGLSGNQRKRAEKWLTDFETDMRRLVTETTAATEGEIRVSEDGHVIVEGQLA